MKHNSNLLLIILMVALIAAGCMNKNKPQEDKTSLMKGDSSRLSYILPSPAPQGHSIVRVIDKDIKALLASAALGQEMIKTAPACLFYSADFSITTRRYGERGRERYVCMDLGHSAENVYLQAEALHLGTCAIGAFNDAEVRAVMQLPENEESLYIMPIGRYYQKSEF